MQVQPLTGGIGGHHEANLVIFDPLLELVPLGINELMAQCVKVWFDREADFLEVTFADGMGYMRETDHDSVMERVGSELIFLQ